MPLNATSGYMVRYAQGFSHLRAAILITISHWR